MIRWVKSGKLARLRAMRRDGDSYAECAAALGVSYDVVRGAIERYGLVDRRRPEVYELVARFYRAGLVDAKIAAACGVSHRAVWKWRQKNGLAPNGKQGWSRLRKSS